MIAETLRLGVAGLGTVGAGVLTLVNEHAEMLSRRAGRRLVVTAVSARDRNKERGLDLEGIAWFEDPVQIARDPHVDVVLELIGGSEGVAKSLVETALAEGKHVVTANKALIAVHGPALAAMADQNGLALAFEAAVAGGIPAIKGVRDGLAANPLTAVYGILNGTCNYILTEMRETGREFADVLAEAQALGYAEADPSFDVDGIDAAHKLAILAGLSFNGQVTFHDLYVEGIGQISAIDIAYAEELGFRIKLLGIARQHKTRSNRVELRVHPCMVPLDMPIASVEGVFNAVVAQGGPVDQVMMVGRGAGAGPTASAVVADVIDIARGIRAPTLGIPTDMLPPLLPVPIDERVGAYYVRMRVVDQAGVIADIGAAMRDQGVSIESFLQKGRSTVGGTVLVILVTHECAEANLRRALALITGASTVVDDPLLIRIEPLGA